MHVVFSPSWQQRIATPFIEGLQAFRNFLRHRDLLWQMVGNDLRGRYIGSLLGVCWNVLHPLVLIGIYTVVFSQVMGARLGNNRSPFAFSIYLCAGLLPWTVCVEIINRCTSVFWEHANLVKKIAFPKVLLHAYIAAAGAINLVIMVVLFIGFLWMVAALPPLQALIIWGGFLLLQLVFAVGIGFVTSVLNVFFRDVAQVTAVLLQLWFWLTPIVYVVDVLPPSMAELLRYNIMARFTSVHHALVLRGEGPPLEEGLFLLQVSLVTLMIGLVCFRALRRRIPDEL